MKSKKWLTTHTIVRFNDILRRVKNEKYARIFVYRLIKQGILKKVIRGIYTTSNDIFPIACNIFYPSYISFLSASYKLGFTEIIPRVISIVIGKKHKPIEFEGYRIEFVQIKEIWGYHKEEDIFLADTEKLMIDAFLRPKSMGNFEEIENIFKRADKINVKKILTYLKKLNSNKAYKRVGYLLEKYNGIDLKGVIKLDKNYHDLNPFKKGTTINKKWRL